MMCSQGLPVIMIRTQTFVGTLTTSLLITDKAEEKSSPVHLHPAASAVSPHLIMHNSIQMVDLRVEPRGSKQRW